MRTIVLAVVVFAFCISCKNEAPDNNQLPKKDLEEQFVKTSVEIAYNNYNDVLTLVQSLDQKIQSFISSPDSTEFSEIKNLWKKAHDTYSQTEVFRFQNGPIDKENGPEPYINAWPLDETYIEYGDNVNQIGLINDTSKVLTEDLLRSKNEEGGEKNISLGFHAIEFLLWGKDFEDPSNQLPGQRSFRDYTEGMLAQRRAQYLQLTTQVLVKDIEKVVLEWQTDGTYRKEFLSLPISETIKKILTGMHMLAKDELAGERIYTALNNVDQEDEQSCFSDHTRQNIYFNFKGVENLYRGSYKGLNNNIIKGVGLHEIIENSNLENLFNTLDQSIQNIPQPFDYALLQDKDNGEPIMKVVLQLQELGEVLEKVKSSF